jgi:hypothetical protein
MGENFVPEASRGVLDERIGKYDLKLAANRGERSPEIASHELRLCEVIVLVACAANEKNKILSNLS